MSETKYTKGEWEIYVSPVYLNQGYTSVESGEGRIFGCKMYNSDQVEKIANAHLIAAAPELYAMLEQLSDMDGNQMMKKEINELLTKARGE